MVTNDGKRFQTCPATLTPSSAKLTISSSSVMSGETIYLDATQMPDEFFNNSRLQIVTLSGSTLTTIPIKEKVTSLDMTMQEGIYIIYVTSNAMRENFKVRVK